MDYGWISLQADLSRNRVGVQCSTRLYLSFRTGCSPLWKKSAVPKLFAEAIFKCLINAHCHLFAKPSVSAVGLS